MHVTVNGIRTQLSKKCPFRCICHDESGMAPTCSIISEVCLWGNINEEPSKMCPLRDGKVTVELKKSWVPD